MAKASSATSGRSGKSAKPTEYRFSFGPWNIHAGADPFGPTVRKDAALREKLSLFPQLGFDYVQFHDDDAVANDLDAAATAKAAKDLQKLLKDQGLKAEFVAPRLWEDPRTIDGGYTATDPKDRKYAIERSKRAIDIARNLGTRNIVLWLAREGTYIREAKDPIGAVGRIVEAMDAMLEYDPEIRILGEMKPNEPMDQAYLPTPGHFMGLIYKTRDPQRVGVLIESAHTILAGLDPSDDMAYTLWQKKLWGVHLNDQNGLKYDEDKTFGSVDLRRAFNQVWVLERGGFGRNGEVVGLDVKAMRTTRQEDNVQHLVNSRRVFLALLERVRSLDLVRVEQWRKARQYEQLEMYIVEHLLGLA